VIDLLALGRNVFLYPLTAA